MLRQIHIFYNKKHLFVHSYALALGSEELENTIRLLGDYIENPMPGKTFHRAIGEKFQIFHRGAGAIYVLFITDLIDSITYIDKIIINLFNMFKELFSNPEDIQREGPAKAEFLKFLGKIQKDLHSKIAIAGPIGSGKTTLYNLIRSGQERMLSNFAKISEFVIENLYFDLWSFQLKDNRSLLWNKFLGGSDLIILLFDCSNYNIQVINYFLEFQKKEGRFSKFLIIANKRDLVTDSDLKKIKNELNIIQFHELSLTEQSVKSKIFQLLKESLDLKKTLPENFEELMNKAETLESQRKLVEAIRAYKDLIFLCNEYQDFTHIESFKNKVEELQKKLKEQVELKRKLDRKKKFKIPEKRVFSSPIIVKELPTANSHPQLAVAKVSPQKANEIKPATHDQKLKSSVKDFRLDLSAIEQLSKIAAPIKEKQEIKIMTPREFAKLVNNKDIAKVLQSMIEKEGSVLSLNLSEKFIEEMQTSLSRTLTYDDLVVAANCFINQENN